MEISSMLAACPAARQIREHLHLDAMTVTASDRRDVKGAEVYNDDVIDPSPNPSTRRARLRC